MLKRLTREFFIASLMDILVTPKLLLLPEDQEKATFTCPFGAYAFRKMSFGLYNALATFQKCMIFIFSYLVK